MQVTKVSHDTINTRPEEQGSRSDELRFLEETLLKIKKKQASSPHWFDVHYINRQLQHGESVLEYMQKNPKATLADAYIAKGMEGYDQQLNQVSWMTPKVKQELLESGKKNLEETAQNPRKLREALGLNLPPPVYH